MHISIKKTANGKYVVNDFRCEDWALDDLISGLRFIADQFEHPETLVIHANPGFAEDSNSEGDTSNGMGSAK